MNIQSGESKGSAQSGFDHGSDPNFLEYYAKESQSDATIERFTRIRDRALSLWARGGGREGALDVLDIGCGAGTQARLWARLGHRVTGLDVNAPLIQLARRRAVDDGLEVQFDIGTATALPYESDSADVCLLPELLEHVADWESCLMEAVRVLRPGGILYLSTSNRLCPVQQEFTLPLYSWYPALVKRYCEKLAATTRPQLANFAKYPAVHWFTFYGLRDFLAPLGMDCRDRFDMIDIHGLGVGGRLIVQLVRTLSPLRFLGHVCTEGTTIYAMKHMRQR